MNLRHWIDNIEISDLGQWAYELPWNLTNQANTIISQIITASPSVGWSASNNVLIHDSATVEEGAVVKGPAIVGPNCFVAANAYLRGGVWMQKNCIIGPSCEIKSSYLFNGAKIAHLSFVGDSIIGAHANIEAGAIIANYRNEKDDKKNISRPLMTSSKRASSNLAR